MLLFIPFMSNASTIIFEDIFLVTICLTNLNFNAKFRLLFVYTIYVYYLHY